MSLPRLLHYESLALKECVWFRVDGLSKEWQFYAQKWRGGVIIPSALLVKSPTLGTMAPEGATLLSFSHLWLCFYQSCVSLLSSACQWPPGQCVVPGAGCGSILGWGTQTLTQQWPGVASLRALLYWEFPTWSVLSAEGPGLRSLAAIVGMGPLAVLRFEASDLVLGSALVEQDLEVPWDSFRSVDDCFLLGSVRLDKAPSSCRCLCWMHTHYL